MKKKNAREKRIAREAAQKKARRQKIYLVIIGIGLGFMLLGLIANLIASYL